MTRSPKICILILLLGLGFSFNANSQNPERFAKTVNELVTKDYHFKDDKPLVVFTGSSSIRMWKDIQDYFPDYHIINNGFGGSTFWDLCHYYKELIVSRKPDVLFIYEGDNDLIKTTPEQAIKHAEELLRLIKKELPQTRIVLITPKPSIARWDLKNDYKKMNRLLAQLASRTDNVELANVWDAMLDSNGVVYQDIFKNDNLHMNKKGYDMWYTVLKDFIKP